MAALYAAVCLPRTCTNAMELFKRTPHHPRAPCCLAATILQAAAAAGAGNAGQQAEAGAKGAKGEHCSACLSRHTWPVASCVPSAAARSNRTPTSSTRPQARGLSGAVRWPPSPTPRRSSRRSSRTQQQPSRRPSRAPSAVQQRSRRLATAAVRGQQRRRPAPGAGPPLLPPAPPPSATRRPAAKPTAHPGVLLPLNHTTHTPPWRGGRVPAAQPPACSPGSDQGTHACVAAVGTAASSSRSRQLC